MTNCLTCGQPTDVDVEAVREANVELAGEVARLGAELARLNSPVYQPFAEAVVNEACHQLLIGRDEHDANKSPWDWFWTLGYLSQKAAHAMLAGDAQKALHHTISSAALLANWHRWIAEQAQLAELPFPDNMQVADNRPRCPFCHKIHEGPLPCAHCGEPDIPYPEEDDPR